MYATADTATPHVYECFECGRRVTDPLSRDCDRCGGELRNLSRARDL